MARQKRKSSKAEIEKFYRKCRYCKANRNTRLFDKHEAACKTRWIIRLEKNQRLRSESSALEYTTRGTMSTIQPQDRQENCMDRDDFIEGSSAQMEVAVEEVASPSALMPLAVNFTEPNSGASE